MTEPISVMYIASDYGPLIDHIYDASDANRLKMIGFFYDTKSRKDKLPIPDYADYFFEENKFARGPFLYLYRLRRVARKCAEEVKKYKPDILHGHMMFCDGIICRSMHKKYGINYVISVRNTDMNLCFLWKLPWIRKRGIEIVLNSKKIIFINNPYTNLFLERMPIKYRRILRRKMTVIPNGVDKFWHDNKWVPQSLDGNKSINLLTVGRVEKNKNQETVAKVIDILKLYGIEAKYTNVGSIEDEDIADRLRINKNIRLVDNLPKEKLIDYYRKADIFVLVSHRETFGLVYVEAMTQGLPVIYSKGQGFDGMFCEGEIGYRANSNDSREITDVILKIIDNYSAISRNCIEYSNRFTWDRVAEEFYNIYKN